MRFFKVSAKVNSSETNAFHSFLSSNSVAQITDLFNSDDINQYCFVKEANEDYNMIVFGVITKDNSQPYSIVERFAKDYDLGLGKILVVEQFTYQIGNYLEDAERSGYIVNRLQILERFDISAIGNRNDPTSGYWRNHESFIDNVRRKDGIVEELKSIGETDVVGLVESIFDRTFNKKVIALNGTLDDKNYHINHLLNKKFVLKAIAESLWNNDYIKPQRYSRINLFSGNEPWRYMVQEVVQANNDGLVVFDLSCLDEAYMAKRIDECKQKIIDDITFLSDIIKHYPTTTVVLIYPTNKTILDMVNEVLKR